MEKEYKFVKDFEGIFDENQKINLYIFDLEENSHILGFSGKAGIFYQLINKNAKFGKFYGEFEVIDMFQSSADEETLIIICKFSEKTLKDKLEEVKPILKAKKNLKEGIKKQILHIENVYRGHLYNLEEGYEIDEHFDASSLITDFLEDLDDLLIFVGEA